jgi:hypothetical protein
VRGGAWGGRGRGLQGLRGGAWAGRVTSGAGLIGHWSAGSGGTGRETEAHPPSQIEVSCLTWTLQVRVTGGAGAVM